MYRTVHLSIRRDTENISWISWNSNERMYVFTIYRIIYIINVYPMCINIPGETLIALMVCIMYFTVHNNFGFYFIRIIFIGGKEIKIIFWHNYLFVQTRKCIKWFKLFYDLCFNTYTILFIFALLENYVLLRNSLYTLYHIFFMRERANILT